MNTPISDFTPTAIATIIKCQNILAEYVVPHSGISDQDCINNLLGVLDDQHLVKQINAIKASCKPKVSTGIKVKGGVEAFEDNDAILNYETITLIGKIKLIDGEWCIYKDEGNYLGLLENKDRISIIK